MFVFGVRELSGVILSTDEDVIPDQSGSVGSPWIKDGTVSMERKLRPRKMKTGPCIARR